MAGARERKRAERRKRKRRSGEVPAAGGGQATVQTESARPPAQETFKEKMARRYEERNAEARAKLEPLEQGQRPLVVTIAALISASIVVSIVAAYAAGAEVNGERPNILQVLTPALLLTMMAWGLWRSRYWAVLGFQVLLALVIIPVAVSLTLVESVWEAIGRLLVLGAAGACFYFMIRAMGRIQMPSPPGAD